MPACSSVERAGGGSGRGRLYLLRERPDMMSASEGGHGKAEVLREVA